MIKKILTRFSELLPLILFSLVPLLWFVPGHLINPNDTNFPLDPIALFKQRLFTWNDQHGIGINFSFDTAGISFHGLQALIYFLGFSVIETEKIFLCFWFFLITASFYFFLKYFLGEEENKIILLAGTIFYIFNPYLFSIFSNINAANLAALFFIPISTKFLLKLVLGQMSFKKFLTIFPFICFLAAPIGINFPVLAVVIFYFVFLLFSLILYSRRLKFKRILLTFFLFAFLFFIFNAYWILPDMLVLTQKNAFNLPSGTELRTLLSGFSEFNGINNLFRLQGDWVWRYPGFRGEKFVVYADNFITNPILIVVSYLAPIIFILTLIFVERKFLVFGGGLLLVSLVFSSGNHLPLGSIFLFLVNRLPFLSIFRSPWYKFSLLTVFVYALSAGLFFQYILGKVKQKGILLIIFLAFGQLIYGYPLLTRAIFPNKRKSLPPAQFIIPEHPRMAANFLNQFKSEFTVISLPNNPADVYYWGFNGPYDLLNLYAPSKGVLAGPAQNNGGGIYEVFYQGLTSGYPKLSKLMNFMNSRYLIHKKDIIFDFYNNYDEPDLIKNLLLEQKNLVQAKDFGTWSLYENLAALPGVISVSKRINKVFGNKSSLPQVITLPEFNEREATFFTDDDFPKGQEAGVSYWPLELQPKRVDYVYNYNFPVIKHSPSSPFYFLVRFKERYQLGKIAPLSADFLQFKLQLIGKRFQELKTLVEKENRRQDAFRIESEIIGELKFLDGFLFEKDVNPQNQPYFLNISLPAVEAFEQLFTKGDFEEKQFNTLKVATTNLRKKIIDYLENVLSNQEYLRYQVYLQRKDVFSFYLLRVQNPEKYEAKKIELEIDKKKTTLFLKNGQDGWLKAENVKLDQGKHIIGIPIKFLEGFSHFSDWRLLNASWVENKLTLNGNEEMATATTKVILADNINPTVLDLKFNALPGSEFRIEEYQVNRNNYQTRFQPGVIQSLGAFGWEKFSFDFQTDLKTDYLSLSFTLKPLAGERSKNFAQIQNLRVFKKPKLPILVKEKDTKNMTGDISPLFDFVKKSPTHYRVKVKNSRNPFFLIFRQAFSPLWSARINNEKLAHFNQAGYFNSWLVDQTGDFEIIIDYLPQWMFIFGLRLTVLSLIISYLITIFKKNEKK